MLTGTPMRPRVVSRMRKIASRSLDIRFARRPAEVLCGVNLPMLLKMATVDRTLTHPIALAEELRDAGRRSIRLGSELTGKVAVGESR